MQPCFRIWYKSPHEAAERLLHSNILLKKDLWVLPASRVWTKSAAWKLSPLQKPLKSLRQKTVSRDNMQTTWRFCAKELLVEGSFSQTKSLHRWMKQHLVWRAQCNPMGFSSGLHADQQCLKTYLRINSKTHPHMMTCLLLESVQEENLIRVLPHSLCPAEEWDFKLF